MSTPQESPKIPIHIMLDLETLGTKPGCKILGIGATVFGEDSRSRFQDFEMYIHRGMQGDLIEEPGTLIWWDEQSQEAKDEVFNRNTVFSLDDALEAFSAWILQVTEHSGHQAYPVVWGNAASFDCEILAYAYRHFGMTVPWNFRHQMCYRTLKNLFSYIQPDGFVGIKHTPLADAQFQAAHAEKILKLNRISF